MALRTLVSCTPVKIYPGKDDTPPQNVTVGLTVGGSVGDGSVVVHSGAPAGPVAGSVGTGIAGSIGPVPAATAIFIHYVANPGCPTTVEVDVELEIS